MPRNHAKSEARKTPKANYLANPRRLLPLISLPDRVNDAYSAGAGTFSSA